MSKWALPASLQASSVGQGAGGLSAASYRMTADVLVVVGMHLCVAQLAHPRGVAVVARSGALAMAAATRCLHLCTAYHHGARPPGVAGGNTGVATGSPLPARLTAGDTCHCNWRRRLVLPVLWRRLRFRPPRIIGSGSSLLCVGFGDDTSLVVHPAGACVANLLACVHAAGQTGTAGRATGRAADVARDLQKHKGGGHSRVTCVAALV